MSSIPAHWATNSHETWATMPGLLTRDYSRIHHHADHLADLLETSWRRDNRRGWENPSSSKPGAIQGNFNAVLPTRAKLVNYGHDGSD